MLLITIAFGLRASHVPLSTTSVSASASASVSVTSASKKTVHLFFLSGQNVIALLKEVPTRSTGFSFGHCFETVMMVSTPRLCLSDGAKINSRKVAIAARWRY